VVGVIEGARPGPTVLLRPAVRTVFDESAMVHAVARYAGFALQALTS
jgi:hypothetical protein